MKPEHKAAIKKGAAFGLVGAGLLSVLGNPAAWAVLGYATYRVGKAAYIKEQGRAKLQASEEDPNLFI
jgi:hypothetical protein